MFARPKIIADPLASNNIDHFTRLYHPDFGLCFSDMPSAIFYGFCGK
jgi:hypothetical protein